jgi:hypothetical protein
MKQNTLIILSLVAFASASSHNHHHHSLSKYSKVKADTTSFVDFDSLAETFAG